MPHIRMRAVSADHVSSLSESLVEPLAQVMQTSVENFTFECISSQYFERGKATQAYPFIEVHWFARSQEVQDQSAKLITEQVKALTKAQDISVVFQALKPEAYYDNGTHF